MTDLSAEVMAQLVELDISFGLVEEEHTREHVRVTVPLSMTRACSTGLREALLDDNQEYLRRFVQYVMLIVEDTLWENYDSEVS